MADKKRIIYAEDLFEPVDFTVLQVRKGGPGGGKTMAMYEQLFRKRVEMAPTVDAVVLPCKVRGDVWLIHWWKGFQYEYLKQPIQRTILHYDIRTDGLYAHFYDGCINTKYFGKLVFLTREEAEAALAKMDGGNEDA